MTPKKERIILWLIAAVQCLNILEFMMVMPLGPDYAVDLKMALSNLGWVGSSYTCAAAVSGFIGGFFLDKYDRKKVLVISLLGLSIGTTLGAFCHTYQLFLLSRIVTGLFGGPATAISFSIVFDTVAKEKLGKALGFVMGSFSVASVVGIPFVLQVSHWGGWRSAFIITGLLALLLVATCLKFLPSITDHLHTTELKNLGFIFKPPYLLTLFITGAIMTAGFLIIPNISTYVLYNFHYPRSQLGVLYLIGGTLSFFMMRFVGHLTDKWGAVTCSFVAALFFSLTIYFAFVKPDFAWPILPFFVAYMVFNSARLVAANTLLGQVPKPHERARFMSFRSSVQNLSCGVAAFASTRFLTENADKSLVGMPTLGVISLGLSILLPFLIWKLDRMMKTNR